MNTDAFFCIGKTHSICQDYAEAGKDHVIISDGCSSSPESNVGAILLSRAVKLFLHKFPYHGLDVMCHSSIATAYAYAKALDLPEDSLCATLGTLKVTDLKFEATLWGDGVIAARRWDTGGLANITVWDVRVWEFTSGAPYYLRYNLDPACEEQYLEKFGTESKCTVYEVCIDDCVTDGYSMTKKGIFTNKDITDGSLGPFNMQYPFAHYDLAAIFSDGVTSFSRTVTNQTSKRNEPVPVCEILSSLLRFKNYNGQFVQRRCKAAFHKFSEQNLWNADDFSMGAIYRPYNETN